MLEFRYTPISNIQYLTTSNIQHLTSKIQLLKKRRVKILLVFLIGSLIILPTFSSIAQAQAVSPTPTPTNAEGEGGGVLDWFLSSLFGPLMGVLSLIVYGALHLAGWFLMLCGRLLNATLSSSLYENLINQGIVNVGWAIVRDVCNLFFILILLIIAFATILRLETYDIKRMLPRLLIVALLINFSKMICGLIIDASQILMNTFLDAFTGKSFSGFVSSVSGIIAQLKEGFWLTFINPTPFSVQNQILSRMGFGALIFLVQGIVFLFLAALLIIRVVALWILVIFAPLAWLIGILPTGKKFADQWWNYFIRYCFFGPIMAFLLYLSWRSWAEIQGFTMSAQIEGVETHNFLSYVVISILLIASALVAKSLGIAGAGFMVSGAKRLAGWGTKKITAVPRREMRKAGVSAGAAVLSKIGFKGVARRMKAVELARREAEARKKYAPAYARMTDEDLEEEVEGAVGIKRAVAAQAALARASFRVWKPDVAERAKATLERYGLKEEVRVLEGQQPAIAKDINEVLERIGVSGMQKLTAPALTPEVMQGMQTQLTTSEFAKVYRGWAKRTRDAAETAMQSQFTQKFDIGTPEGKANVEMRKYFAAATGKAAVAFKEPQAQEEARKYILSLKGENLGRLKAKVDWEMAGEHIGVGQLASAGLELSEEQKRGVIEGVKRAGRKEVLDAIKHTETWVGPIVKKKKKA